MYKATLGLHSLPRPVPFTLDYKMPLLYLITQLEWGPSVQRKEMFAEERANDCFYMEGTAQVSMQMLKCIPDCTEGVSVPLLLFPSQHLALCE